MSTRLILIVPLVVVAALLAVVGLRLGYMAATTSETDVITHYSALYVDRKGTGAAVTDCFAVPGQGAGIWLVVTCSPGGAGDDEIYTFYINRLGGLEKLVEPGDQDATETFKDQT